MLFNVVKQLVEAQLAVENLALSVNNVFLQIVRSRLTDAEVLGAVRHVIPKLPSHSEVVIDRVTRGKYDTPVRL